MTNKTFIIYMATNTITGSRYVGATSRGLDVRRRKHLRDANAAPPGCRIFNRAIRKYGAEAFKWEVISKLQSFDEMMEEEIRLIAKLKPEYNISRGGEGVVGVPRTAEWLAKVSRALKGRKLSAERIAAMRLRDRGYMSKSVVCLNDGKWFKSISSAAQHYHINQSGISLVLSGRMLSTGGLSFCFSKSPMAEDEISNLFGKIKKSILEEKTQQRSHRRLLKHKRGKKTPILLVESGERFDGIADAARQYRLNEKKLRSAIRRGKACSGFTFRRLDASGHQVIVSQQRIARQVLCLDDMTVSNSMLGASKKYGVHPSTFATRCAARKKDARFVFLDEWCPNPE